MTPTKNAILPFKVLKIIVTLMGCLLLAVPLAAQDEAPPCTADLAPVRELLDQVDAAIGDSASEDALALMQSASEELQILIDACTPIPPIELTQTLVIHNGQLTVNFPEDWVSEVVVDSTDPEDPSNAQFATTSAVFDQVDGPTPTMNPGDQLVFLITGMPDSFVDGLDNAPSAPTILKAIQQTISESGDEEKFEFDEIQQISINDRRAASLELSYESFDGKLFVVELEREKTYVVLMALSAPGELEALAGAAQEMAESLQYNPAAPAESGSSAEPDATEES